MVDTVLVTGISGFLGGHVALALLNAGYAVRGSVRDLKKADKVRETLDRASGGKTQGLDFVALDLSSDEGWLEATRGCRYVQHVASPFVTVMPKDKEELIRPAVEGTRRALRAALAEKVERIVLTSSFAAVGYGHRPGRSFAYTEADWTNPDGPDVNAYIESKLRAEREAWSLVEACGRRDALSVVNPTAILGPVLDNDPGTSGMLVLRMLKGSVPAVPNIYFGIVDARDVAAMQVKAMETPSAGGQRYLAAAESMSFFEIASTLRVAMPDYAAKLPRREMPNWLARVLALFVAELRDNVGRLGVIREIDGSKGAALLGRPLISGADAAIALGKSLVAEGLA